MHIKLSTLTSRILNRIAITLLFLLVFSWTINSYSQTPGQNPRKTAKKTTLEAKTKTPPFELYQPKDKPFWKVKKSVRARLREREIFVSVTSGEKKKKDEVVLQELYLKGVGWIRAPFAKVREKINRYQELKTLAPDQFEEIRHDKEKNHLYVHGVAMKWHARMHLQLFAEEVSPGTYRLHWHVFKGSFRGLKGYFELEEQALLREGYGQDSGRRNVEYSMTAFYQSERLPLPSFLLRFGLETVLRVVARKMRKYLESDLT